MEHAVLISGRRIGTGRFREAKCTRIAASQVNDRSESVETVIPNFGTELMLKPRTPDSYTQLTGPALVMGFFTTIKRITSIDCGRGVGGGEVRLDANVVEGGGIWCGSTLSVADVGEGREGTVEERVAGAVGLRRRRLCREETGGTAVAVA